MSDSGEWRPGSFTKNFSWGPKRNGLKQLYDLIRVGFAGELKDTPRTLFRKRVRSSNNPDYVALNFFLYNRILGGEDHVVADELVFQALSFEHSQRFDKLALFAFNFSYVGVWNKASSYQRRPALWAFHYIADHVAKVHGWDTSKVSADDIEKFISNDARYTGRTTRKLATNLSYLYSIGGLGGFRSERVERWWVDSLFLALDRLIEDRASLGQTSAEARYRDILERSKFLSVAGKSSIEKSLAVNKLTELYVACGGRGRFSDEFVQNRTKMKIPDVVWLLANDHRPQGAVHPTNIGILKSIPRACAMLARYMGFDVIDADELQDFDAEEFIRRHTRDALKKFQLESIKPTMSAEALMKLTRDK